MAEINHTQTVERLSLGLAVISLALTIYFSGDKSLQVIFSVLFILFLIFYFIYKNTLATKQNTGLAHDFNMRLQSMEKKLDIYRRLDRLEKEVFKK